MLTTPHFGIPYAEPEDPTREYPDTVDAPGAAIVDDWLYRLRPVTARTSASAISCPASTYVVPTWVNDITLPGIWTMVAGSLTVHRAGIYQIQVRIQMATPGGKEFIAAYRVAADASEFYTAREASSASTVVMQTIDVRELPAGSVIIPKVWANAAVTLTNAWFMITYLGQ